MTWSSTKPYRLDHAKRQIAWSPFWNVTRSCILEQGAFVLTSCRHGAAWKPGGGFAPDVLDVIHDFADKLNGVLSPQKKRSRQDHNGSDCDDSSTNGSVATQNHWMARFTVFVPTRMAALVFSTMPVAFIFSQTTSLASSFSCFMLVT